MGKLKSIHLPEVRNIYVSPKVDFDAETGICEISGESFLDETAKFYSPLVEWIEEYIKTKRPITLNIKLTYFNTSSSKWLLRMLYLLANYQKEAEATVNWYIHKDDIDLMEDIQDFKDDVGIDINIKFYEDEETDSEQKETNN